MLPIVPGRPDTIGASLLAASACLTGLLLSASADAQEGEEFTAPPVSVHGFVSQGFIRTTQHDYLADSDSGSFEFTEGAINFTAEPAEHLRVGIQLFARDLGPLGNYTPRFDWFYLDYRFADWFGIRAGRTKLPLGLYNETSDIDAARVPILLPQSIYPIQNRDYLLAQTGGEIYGTFDLRNAGELEYRLYGGTFYYDESEVENTTEADVDIPYIYGGRLMWQTPLEGLQVGASGQSLKLETELALEPDLIAQLQMVGVLPPGFDGILSYDAVATIGIASAEYTAENLSLAAEYSRWFVSLDSRVPEVVPDDYVVSERFYVMAAYRVASWFTPGVYYSAYFPDTDERSGRAAYQHDLALSLRYDINPYWIAKLEGHYMRGTAGLSSALNGNADRSTLAPDWGVFLFKTTAYF